MKIYIPNILPITLKNKLDKFLVNFADIQTKIKYEIISKEYGFIIIEEQNISHLEPSFKNEYELIKNYKNLDLLVDKNKIVNVPIISQFPVNYIHNRSLQLYFKISKKSNLTLVIECIEEPNNFELSRIPVDFYFEYDNENLDLKDPLFEEQFNMFLSYLN